MTKPLIFVCFLVVMLPALSSELNGGVLYGYDGYGAYNNATYNLSAGVMHPVDNLLDLTIRCGYSRGLVKDSTTRYQILNACIGVDAHGLFGTRNPYLGVGAGYYRITDLWLNPGVMERPGGYVFLDVRGLVGGPYSPFDIDLRWENHFIANIANTYTEFIKGTNPYFTSYAPAKEVRTVYTRTMVYIVMSLGFRFKFL